MNPTYAHLVVLVMAWIVALTIPSSVHAQDSMAPEKLMDMDLKDLLNMDVSVASKKEEAQTEAPGVVVVVPREEIEVYGDRTLHQLLQRQPSVHTQDTYIYSNTIAAFRGDTSNLLHALILLNGRPLRDSAYGGMNSSIYMTFPLVHLGSVELIRGPGSVLYGTNAFSGVVNLKSRPIPDHTKVSVSGMAGSYGSYDTAVSLGGRSGKLGFVADARVAGQDGWPYRLTDRAGVYGEEDKYDRSVSGTAHLDYRGLTFDVFGSDLDAFALGVVPLWSNPHHSFRNKKLFLNTGYRVPLHERMTLELNATYNLQENALSGPAPMMIGTNTSDLLGEVTLLANPLDNLNVVLGGLQEYRTNYQSADDEFQSIPPYHYSPRSAYAQADYTFGHTVKVIAGTQWNESAQGFEDWGSRYGVILTPFKKWGVKLLRGEAFRAPVALESDLYDLPLYIGNKDLKPETITTYDAQLFYDDEKTYAAVTYFHSTINDPIIMDRSVRPMTYLNRGEQRFNGIELECKRLLTPHWHAICSFMHQENESDLGIAPSSVPANMVKLGMGYTWDGGSASVFWCHFGTPPYDATTLGGNPVPEAMNLISLNVRLDMSTWMGGPKGRTLLTVRAENLLDQDAYISNAGSGSYPYGPGRTAYAGLTVNF